MTSGDADNSHVVVQQQVILVVGKEEAALHKIHKVARGECYRSHMQEGSSGANIGGDWRANIHLIREANTQEEALRIADIVGTPVLYAQTPGTPPMVGAISTKSIVADARRVNGDLTQMQISQVARVQKVYRQKMTIKGNFLMELMQVIRLNHPEFVGNPRYLRHAVTVTPDVLSELHTEQQTWNRCRRVNPVRIGKAHLEGRDLAKDQEEHTRTTRNMGLCSFCLRGLVPEEMFAGSPNLKLQFNAATNKHMEIKPDPLLHSEKPPGLLEDLRAEQEKKSALLPAMLRDGRPCAWEHF